MTESQSRQPKSLLEVRGQGPPTAHSSARKLSPCCNGFKLKGVCIEISVCDRASGNGLPFSEVRASARVFFLLRASERRARATR